MIKKIGLTLGLILAAAAERLWFDLGPNIELVMTASVVASIYLGKRYGVLVAVAALALTDLVIGNTRILIFTWSGFGLIGYAANWLKGKSGWLAGGYGLAAALFFYFYTNFGVFLIGNLYPHNWQGLVECYVMGLPFLKLHAVSSIVLLSTSIESLRWFGQLRWKSETVPQL